jgi:uncharacterized protein (TIGR01732 family)
VHKLLLSPPSQYNYLRRGVCIVVQTLFYFYKLFCPIGGEKMGWFDGYDGGYGGSSFVLIVVLFILLIIVGATFMH